MNEDESQLPSIIELERHIMERTGWRKPDDIPKTLYHYTSSGAFLSIVSSGELWFTDFRYLGDLSELTYGAGLFINELSRREERENDSALRAILGAIQKQFETVHTDVFVFSMCAEKDLLNQWRVYGRDTVPISIEFATRGFLVDWEPYSFEIIPLMYDINEQRRIVSEVVLGGIHYASALKAKQLTSESSMESFIQDWTTICIDWCMLMKHPQFEVEHIATASACSCYTVRDPVRSIILDDSDRVSWGIGLRMATLI